MDFAQAVSFPVFVVFLGIIVLQFYHFAGNFSYSGTNYGLDVLKNKILHRETSILTYIGDELKMESLDYEEEEDFGDNLHFQPKPPSEPQSCDCNPGRLCIMDFLKRFKGIEFDQTSFQDKVVVKFQGPNLHLEVIKNVLKRNNYEMVFGEPSARLRQKPNVAEFLDAFCGIEVVKEGKIIFKGHVNQLKFIKQQLKAYEYEMIFGDIESEDV